MLFFGDKEIKLLPIYLKGNSIDIHTIFMATPDWFLLSWFSIPHSKLEH